jgi:hypothetical protein
MSKTSSSATLLKSEGFARNCIEGLVKFFLMTSILLFLCSTSYYRIYLNNYCQMKLHISILFVLAFLISCEKEEEIILPNVVTENASDLTINSAILIGSVTLLGTEPSLDHGFIWSELSGVSETNGKLISLGPVVKTGLFESTLSGLSRGKKYYYVAFVTVNNKKILGVEQSFTTSAHSITSITPANVKAGDKITIQGNNFVSNPSSIIINIGNSTANVSSATESQIEVDIPPTISGGSKSVKVTIDNIEVTASTEIAVVPFIESTSPIWGFANDVIEIIGSGFGSASEVTVKFNDKTVVVNSSTNNKITVVAPLNSAGINVVKVITNSIPSSNTADFKLFGWKKLSELPLDGRYAASAFVVNDFLYVGLGGDLSGARFDDFWKVDLKTGVATQLKDFPKGARFATNFFSIGEKGYIVLGFDNLNAQSDQLWEYEPGIDQWTQKTSFPGSIRSNSVSFVLNGKAYVGSGIANGVTILDDFYVYDPALDQWTQAVSLGGGPFYGLGSFVVGTKAYVTCGININETSVNEHWEFSGTTWTKQANYPGILIADGLGFNYGDFGCFGFGWVDSNNPGIENWIYYPATNNWRKIENFPGPGRFSAVSGSSSKYWFYGLGYKGNTVYKDIWIIELP